ncbi:TPA: hypothetical protein I8039_001785 [Legionella pneumophila]|nr:hypothetical protein [Legionella pneumophila]
MKRVRSVGEKRPIPSISCITYSTPDESFLSVNHLLKSGSLDFGVGLALCVWILIGTEKLEPKISACCLGKPAILFNSSLSTHSLAALTDLRSCSEVNLNTTQVPHCDKTVDDISEGL